MTVTSDQTAIRPFEFNFSDEELEDLRRRIIATRWPDKETVPDQSQGPQLATMQAVARYWSSEYDWRKVEARLKALPHFVTEIDGLDIHFVHVRSKHEDALPLIVTHGWPGSVMEQLKIIEPLTDPTSYGGKAEDAFHVVIASMPGYGFGGKPTERGWGPEHIASAWVELMRRLGYTKYVAQGGDWGTLVTELMGALAPQELAAIHVNLPGVVPADIQQAVAQGNPLPEGTTLSAEEESAVEQLRFVFSHVYYAFLQADRPQALMAINDSPVGLAAFLMDHDPTSLAMISRSFAGETEGLTRDDFLDNVTYFWLTNSGLSAGRLYAENTVGFFNPKGVKVPTALTIFPNEIYQAPRSWAEKAYPELVHYNKVSKGGHFAAWEQPEIFVDELRTCFRSFR
jgi:pimeloyl-ACP methyl ester carboxylesterase